MTAQDLILEIKNIPIKPAVTADAPIGVFDSGVGGISVLQHIHALLPQEELLYVADSQYAPYGNKTPEEIQSRCIEITDFLITKGVKAIVVACNTATAAAIDLMRVRYALPIIGMEPAVKPAAEASRNGVIGVLATVGTLKSAQFAGLLESYGRNVKVVTQGCIGLVECIERGDLNGADTKALIKRYVQPLLEAHADTIVLGCTHYPFVRHLIEDVVGKQVVLVDTGHAVARHLKHRLEDGHLLNQSPTHAEIKFWTNSLAQDAEKVMTGLWGNSVTVERFDK